MIPAFTPPLEDLGQTPGVLRHLRRLTNAFTHASFATGASVVIDGGELLGGS